MIYYLPRHNVCGVLKGNLIQIEDGRVFRVFTPEWVLVGVL